MRNSGTNLAWRAVASVAAGGAIFYSFPPNELWWLAPIGFGLWFLIYATADNMTMRGGFGYGFLVGLGHFVPLLTWIDTMVGALPWIGLGLTLALFYGAFGALATRLVHVRGAVVWVAAAFVVLEWGRSSFPFGGFPWGRLAFSQGDSPLVSIARWIGAPGLSFAVALVGCGAAAVVIAGVRRLPPRAYLVPGGALVLVVAAAALAWQSVGTEQPGRSVVIAAIQGNVPEQRWDDVSVQRAAVLRNHLDETARLAQDVRAGRQPQPDVVVWPENSSDVSPERDPDVAARMAAAAADVGAPILVGSIHYDDQGNYYNSMMLMTPQGPVERHDKAILQPFGETMPMRDFFRLFSSYVDLANNFTPGTGDGVITPGRDGEPPFVMGVATCYEVAFDRSLQMSVSNGAQVLTVPTNNATFGRTDMTWQQLGMSQVRAVELDRDVIVAATTGVSAVVRADGSVAQNTQIWTANRLVQTVTLRDGLTPAARLGDWVNVGFLILTLCGLALAVRQDGSRFSVSTTQSDATARQTEEVHD